MPAYDNRCKHLVSGGCVPVAIVSAERLQDPSTGPIENRKFARALEGKRGISDYLIAEEAWDCIWEELIVHKKGSKTFLDRKGLNERDYNFSEEMLNAMIQETTRLIRKYGSAENTMIKINTELVSILEEHRITLQRTQ
eukprot:15312202-Ditylum_brightwellii.AAC.1